MKDGRYGFSLTINQYGMFIIYTMIVMFCYILPYTKVTVPYIPMALLMLISLPILANQNRQLLNYSILLVVASVMLMLIYAISDYFTLVEAINEMIRNIRFFIPAMWTIFVYRTCNNNHRKAISAFFWILVFFILYKTISALANNQWITRILAQSATSDTAEIRSYRLGNVGGFEFSYMIGILTMLLVWTAINCKKMNVKVASIVAAVLCFYYIIQTMYTTLLLLTTVGILALVLLNVKNLLTRIALVIGFIVLAFSLPALFGYLSMLLEGSLLSSKFLQIQSALTGGGVSKLGSRPEYMFEAIEGWVHSPIFGGYSYTYKVHSFFVGLLESCGLFGVFTWLMIFRMTHKMISREIIKCGIQPNLFHIVMLWILLLSLLNPIGYCFELTIAALFIVPIWMLTINEWSAEYKVKFN